MGLRSYHRRSQRDGPCGSDTPFDFAQGRLCPTGFGSQVAQALSPAARNSFFPIPRNSVHRGCGFRQGVGRSARKRGTHLSRCERARLQARRSCSSPYSCHLERRKWTRRFHFFNSVILSGVNRLACESIHGVERPAVSLARRGILTRVAPKVQNRRQQTQGPSTPLREDRVGRRIRRCGALLRRADVDVRPYMLVNFAYRINLTNSHRAGCALRLNPDPLTQRSPRRTRSTSHTARK